MLVVVEWRRVKFKQNISFLTENPSPFPLSSSTHRAEQILAAIFKVCNVE